MQRFSLPEGVIAPSLLQPAEEGEWVLWGDVESLVQVCASIAERHDRYRKGLKRMAANPDPVVSAVAKEILDED